jgi:hypothetical protein
MYSATILARPAEILQLNDALLRAFPALESASMPGFFLASLGREWLPRVVVVSRGGELAGIVYAKERAILGWPLGLIYADASFNNMVVAAPAEREAVLRTAIHRLFACRRIQGARIVVPLDGFQAAVLTEAISSMRLEAGFAPVERHACLKLPPCYEEFLETLGGKTRKNFRYYVRKSQMEGHRYFERLSMAELREAAWRLRRKCSIATSSSALTRALTWLAESGERILAVGLRHPDGRWLSVAAGWYGPASATVALQLNDDQSFPRYSLSVVLRAQLIQSLIRQKVESLWFWAGASEPLARYATYLRTTAVYMDRPAPVWKAIRYLALKAIPLLPKRLAGDIVWVSRTAEPASISQQERDPTPIDDGQPKNGRQV